MSDERMAFVYQDKDENWWFAGSQYTWPWFDEMIFIGPCESKLHALACKSLFRNFGYEPQELLPAKTLCEPPKNRQWSIDERKNDLRESYRRQRDLFQRPNVDAIYAEALAGYFETQTRDNHV